MTALTRFVASTPLSLREEDGGGNRLVGHAAVFDRVADLGPRWESVDVRAFDRVLAETGTDVVALFNHDPSMILGRQSAGTLTVRTDDLGLAYEIDLPDTSYAVDLRSLVERGDVLWSSFGFIPGEIERRRAPDGRTHIHHRSVEFLRDVSPVAFAAYESGTEVALRSVDFGRQTRNRSRLIRARARNMKASTAR